MNALNRRKVSLDSKTFDFLSAKGERKLFQLPFILNTLSVSDYTRVGLFLKASERTPGSGDVSDETMKYKTGSEIKGNIFVSLNGLKYKRRRMFATS